MDRALAVVWTGDPLGDEIVGHAYRRLHDAVRARRDALDEQFAARLVTWAAQAAGPGPGGCLLLEDVLAKVVAPLVRQGRAPLIIVADGMSSAVAAELGEQLQERAWTEISPHSGQRLAAASVLPSITRLSRASLLAGKLTEGDQAAESTGFAAFWRARRREAALFHKADLAGAAGHRLAEPACGRSWSTRSTRSQAMTVGGTCLPSWSGCPGWQAGPSSGSGSPPRSAIPRSSSPGCRDQAAASERRSSSPRG